MFSDEFTAAANAAKAKVNLQKNSSLAYFLASMLAGIYVGFGVLLTFTSGALLIDQPYRRIVMGMTFASALSFVVMAGSELFTGNNFVITAGISKKSISLEEGVKSWIVSYIGNWTGSILIAIIFVLSGLADGATGEFIAQSSVDKISIAPIGLIARGILCNMLVCIAVWCSVKLKSESGKLIIIFWAIFVFITSGFEHSIANMTLLTIAMIKPFAQTITLSGYFYNILTVTLGNMIGGIGLIAIPYYIISKSKD